MAVITSSNKPATKPQVKLVESLIDEGVPHELNMLDGMTTLEAARFIELHKDVVAVIKLRERKKRRLEEISRRSTPDMYNVPNH